MESIRTWLERAQIDYKEQYLKLYIAYNAWYQLATNTSIDREAIARLKRRVKIWAQYSNGQTMTEMRQHVTAIARLTADRRIRSDGGKWSGVVADEHDYQNVIEFWYYVRCSLFHGDSSVDERFPEFVQLAYSSLNVFMTEIAHRMSLCITLEEETLLQEIEGLGDLNGSPALHQTRQTLRQKYLHGHNIRRADI